MKDESHPYQKDKTLTEQEAAEHHKDNRQYKPFHVNPSVDKIHKQRRWRR